MIAVALLLGATAKLTIAFRAYSRVEQEFSSINPGDRLEMVNARLGKPNYHLGKCGVIQPPAQTCALEYVYSHPFAPIIPDYYVVTFSNDHRVIEANRWSSP